MGSKGGADTYQSVFRMAYQHERRGQGGEIEGIEGRHGHGHSLSLLQQNRENTCRSERVVMSPIGTLDG